MSDSHPGRTVKLVAVIAFTLCIGGIFAAVSATVNGQPSSEQFKGWITVLQQGSKIGGDQEVMLSATALSPEIQNQHPQLRYSVAACGGGSFRGKLVLGGDARLTDVQAGPASASAIRNEPNFIIRDPLSNSNSNLELGAVQILDIEMVDLPECIPRSSLGQDDLGFSGVAQDVVGLAGAPIQRKWEGLWWNGPRTTQVWPLVGTMSGVPVGLNGVFEGVNGLRGPWTIPTKRLYVYGGAVSSRSTIDIARPELSSDTGLHWIKTQPFTPSVRLTDVETMSNWQQSLVVATIALGIGGSLFASLVFEWTRRPACHSPTPGEASAGDNRNGEKGRDGSRSTLTLVLVFSLIAATWLKSRRRRPG